MVAGLRIKRRPSAGTLLLLLCSAIGSSIGCRRDDVDQSPADSATHADHGAIANDAARARDSSPADRDAASGSRDSQTAQRDAAAPRGDLQPGRRDGGAAADGRPTIPPDGAAAADARGSACSPWNGPSTYHYKYWECTRTCGSVNERFYCNSLSSCRCFRDGVQIGTCAYLGKDCSKAAACCGLQP